MKPSKTVLRNIARERANILIETAVETAKIDLDLARRQARIARRICMKFNVRLPYNMKRFFCKGCKQLTIPGINCRVRLGFKPKALKITCFECGHIYRRILRGGFQARISNP